VSELRKRVDAEGIAHSEFKSLFLRVQDGRLMVENREDLGAVLVSMTLCKVRRAVTHHLQKKRRCSREQPIPDEPVEWDPGQLLKSFQSTDPSADLTAQVALWKLEGNTTVEIAEKCCCSPRTIARKLRLIRKKWLQAEERDSARDGIASSSGTHGPGEDWDPV